MQMQIYAPHAVWPLAYVCLVPWLVAVCTSRNPRMVYLASYLLGATFFLVMIRWLRFSTFEGYVALGLWSGIHYVFVAWAVRHMYRHRGAVLAILVPIVWTMSELARSRTAVGFPWFLLGHSHYRILTMIQISDLVGAFGVSFVIAAVNGWICDLLLQPLLIWRRHQAVRSRRVLVATVFTVAVVGATIIYGRVRLGAHAFADGPRIAVLQGDYALSPELLGQATEHERRETYARLLEAAAPAHPDLFLLPETPWPMYLNREYRERDSIDPMLTFSRSCHEWFRDVAARTNAYVVVGSVSWEDHPTNVYPPYERFNSAFVYAPHRPEPERYDKIHLVLFGEYVPFRYGRLHFVYRKLNGMTPWGASGFEYSLTAGTDHTVFEMHAPSQDGQTYHFAVPICYEDAIPELVSAFVTDPQTGGKRVDFLLNISNDGWFWHSEELPQHLAVCVFRAVENRVGIARAVNTGISGFIDPDGRIHDLVTEPGRRAWDGVTGYRVSRVKVDPRHSLYSRWGDWFALGCFVVGVLCLVDAFVMRIRANWFKRSHGSTLST
jgi:apolipoprotein N-acyltransferase